MKTRVFVFFIALVLIQSLLLFLAAHKMNMEGLTLTIILRFVMLIIILSFASKAIGITHIDSNVGRSKVFRILNYVSAIGAFFFSPLSGLLAGLLYFYFSDWPMNVTAQHVGINLWLSILQMLVFLLVPIVTLIVFSTARRQ